MKPLAIVVLAAGKGKRMQSDLPKVLHPFAGTPIIEHVLKATSTLNAQSTVVVVGHQASRVQEALKGLHVQFVEQKDQLGTGHAVMQCRKSLEGFKGTLMVLVGDVPLLNQAVLTGFLDDHESSGSECTLLTMRLEDPKGYGRIYRSPDQQVQAIVEHNDASPEQLKINEVNSGIMAFETGSLWKHISDLGSSNSQEEYYLTDLVSIFRASGLKVGAWCAENHWEVEGINSPEQLAELERIFYAGARSGQLESD